MPIRYSRLAQRSAEVQMNFVVGVCHQLRTPLRVIRTAAYILRSPAFRRNDDPVERYGTVQVRHDVQSRETIDAVLLDHAVTNGSPSEKRKGFSACTVDLRGRLEGHAGKIDINNRSQEWAEFPVRIAGAAEAIT